MKEVRHLRALQAFDVAATHGSLSIAADELGVTHGAVSRQIKQLEQYLEVRLFDRGNSGVSKTDSGELLHVATQSAFSELQSGVRSLKKDPKKHSVTISLSSSLAIKWLVPKLPEFRSAHPEIAVYLETNDDIIDFSDQRIDLALRYGLPSWEGLYSEQLASEELVVAASPSLIGEKTIPMKSEEIAHLQMLHDRFDPAWERWADAANLHKHGGGSPSIEFNNMALLIAAAIDGQGAIIVRRLLIEEDLNSGRLVRLDHTKTPNDRALYFVCRNGDQGRTPIRLFKTWIAAVLEQDSQ